MFTYFILAGGKTRRVKIGSGLEPEYRLSKIRLMSPVPVRILATLEHGYGQPVENALHTVFAADRVRGEWFNLTDELRALIRAIRRGEDVMPAIYARAFAAAPPGRLYRKTFAKLARAA